jgi:hypothetical protein
MSEYFLLNTNVRFNPDCGEEMINQEKAAAYLNRKNKIERLEIDDVVFLYQSKVGIIAYGKVAGGLQDGPYSEGDEFEKNGEYYKSLTDFGKVEPPLKAAEIRKLVEKRLPFISTMIRLKPEDGEILLEECKRR